MTLFLALCFPLYANVHLALTPAEVQQFGSSQVPKELREYGEFQAQLTRWKVYSNAALFALISVGMITYYIPYRAYDDWIKRGWEIPRSPLSKLMKWSQKKIPEPILARVSHELGVSPEIIVKGGLYLGGSLLANLVALPLYAAKNVYLRKKLSTGRGFQDEAVKAVLSVLRQRAIATCRGVHKRFHRKKLLPSLVLSRLNAKRIQDKSVWLDGRPLELEEFERLNLYNDEVFYVFNPLPCH